MCILNVTLVMQTNLTAPTPLCHFDYISIYYSKMLNENILAWQLRLFEVIGNTDILVLDQVFKKLTR